jgi:3-oxoadipate enol-lactonase
MSEKARVGDLEIAYDINGQGEPLVLIGGFGMVKEMWAAQVQGLSGKFRVIAFDNRGIGESTVTEPGFTIADMAADVAGLMDALGIDRAHIFGVSMGGLISQTLALDHSSRVRKVVLGCTSHGGRHAVAPEPEVMALLATLGDPSVPPEEAIRKRLPVMFSDAYMQTQQDAIEEYVKLSLQYQPTLKGAQGQMQALSFFNVKRRLGEITCPVLVITGDQDRMMPPENAKLLAEGIPGAELYVVKGAGHGFFQENPEETNRAVAAFLSK